MKSKLIKLIDVKTILTFVFAIGYHVFIACNIIQADGYSELVKFIIYFYFGTQVGKKIINTEDETSK